MKTKPTWLTELFPALGRRFAALRARLAASPRPRIRPARIVGVGLLALFAVLALLASSIGWLLCTESGLRWSVGILTRHDAVTAAARIEVQGLRGRWIGPIQLQDLEVATGDARYVARNVTLDWTPGALLDRRIVITQLSAEALDAFSHGTSPITAPTDLKLPLPYPLRIESIAIDTVRVDSSAGQFAVRDLRTTVASDGEIHSIERISATVPTGRLAGRGTIAVVSPFALAATLDFTTRDEGSSGAASDGKPTQLSFKVDGSLLAPAIDAILKSGDHMLEASARAAPFDNQPLDRLHLHGKDVVPRELVRQIAAVAGDALPAVSVEAADALPAASLDFDVDVARDGNGTLIGDLSLINRASAPLDRQGIPLTTLDSRVAVDWQSAERRLRLDDMRATIGEGTIVGRTDLEWTGDAAFPHGSASWRIARIDPSTLHSGLKSDARGKQAPLRYSGTVAFDGDRERQQATLALTDGIRHLDATLMHHEDLLSFSRLALRQGQAELSGKAELKLDDTRTWRYVGRLDRFDPSSFANVPQAELNADFEASGTLLPRFAGRLKFNLQPSRLAKQALAGSGDLSFSGIDSASGIDNLIAANGKAFIRGDLQLRVEDTRIDAHGGWGSPSEVLKLAVNAPNLAQHRPLVSGIAGALDLSATLSGFPARTEVILDARGRRLALPGGYSIRDADAKARLVGDSLTLALTAAQVRSLDGRALPSADLNMNGTRDRHHLRLKLELPEQRRLDLQANGGLRESPRDWRDTGWQGTIESARLTSNMSMTLAAATSLEANRRRVALGNTSIRVADGLLQLSESAWSPERWATRGRFENIALRLDGYEDNMAPAPARANGEWSLAGKPSGSIEGNLRATIPDLRGLGPAIDGNLTSAGELDIDARIAGTLDKPSLNGAINGRRIALGLIDQNVVLRDGTLAVRFSGAEAIIDQLTFVAPQDAPVRAARITGFPTQDGPGQISITGKVDFEKRETHLKAMLKRLPLTQRAERWLVATGSAQLDYAAGRMNLVSRLAADTGFIAEQVASHPKLSSDIVIQGREAKPRSGPRIDADISLDLGDRFHLRAAGLAARLAGQLNLRGDAAETSQVRATGSISAYDATFEAYGQSLAVERGIVNFQGALDDPGLNVLALRKGLAVEAGVTVSGTVQHPIVRLTSTPVVSDAEKLSWIVLGRAPDAGGTDASLLLAAAGTILGSEGQSITRKVAQTLGVDDISLRRSTSGETLSDQILTVGKRLSARTYLSYEQGLAAASGALKLTHSLSRRTSLVTQAGENSAIDIFYRFTFD